MNKTISLTIAAKRIKYLGMSLSSIANGLYTENYSMLLKDIKEGTSKWIDIPCLWIDRINIVKTSLFQSNL